MTLRWFGVAVLVVLASGCGSQQKSPHGLRSPEKCTVGQTSLARWSSGLRISLQMAAHGGTEVVATKVDIGYGSWPNEWPGEQEIQYRLLDGSGNEVSVRLDADFRYVILHSAPPEPTEEGGGFGCFFDPEATGDALVPLPPGARVLEIVEQDSATYADCGDYEPAGRVLARIDLSSCIDQFCDVAPTAEVCE